MCKYVNELISGNFAAVPTASTITNCLKDSNELLKNDLNKDEFFVNLAQKVKLLLAAIDEGLSCDGASAFLNTYLLVQKILFLCVYSVLLLMK